MRDRLGSTDLAPAADAAGPTAAAAAGGIPSRGIETSVANVDALWRSLAGCS
jgi:hypothetical protein